MALSVIYSNRLEELADRLFFPMTVVVPTHAVKNWLQSYLARRWGIAAGIEFLFLEDLLDFPSQNELILRCFSKIKEERPMRRFARAEMEANSLRHQALHGPNLPEGFRYRSFERELHLFGFRHIPPLVVEHLQKATIYLFSPCQMYWEDLCSDKERIRLKQFFREKGAKEEALAELDGFLLDANPLLANWGRLGRRMVASLGEGTECYVLPEEKTLLATLQRDCLLLETTEKLPKDDSLEVHAAPNRLREVEVLFERISHLPFSTEEILVMAPDITPYVPFIRAVFGGKIPFSIADHVKEEENGLEKLLSLVHGRWGASQFLSFFSHLDFKEIDRVREWIRGARIRWGKNVHHQREWLSAYGKSHLSGVSWEEGMERILDQLTITGEIPLSDADELDKLFGWVELLTLDLKALKKHYTPQEWCEFLTAISIRYFGEADPRLDSLRISLNETYPLSVICKLLFKTKRASPRPNVSAVQFSSFKPLPAKVICLLGMEEGAFPRTSIHPLAPTVAEVDRFLFLETLLFARSHLFIFYSHTNEEDGKRQEPCSLVVDLRIEPTVHGHVHRPEKEGKPLVFSLPEPSIIDVRELRQSAVDPARTYLQSRGVFLERDKRLNDHEPFTLDPLALHRRLLQGEELPLPEGPLRFLAEEKIRSRVDLMKQNGIEELTKFALPPTTLTFEGRELQLVGEIPYTCEKGMVVDGKREISTVIKAYPLLLAYQLTHPKSPLFFTRHKKPFLLAIDPKEALQAFLRYHFSCLENPLLPDSIVEEAFAPLYEAWERR